MSVWNPSYHADAMDEHLAIMRRTTTDVRAASAGVNDVYVWWAKIRSPERARELGAEQELRRASGELNTDAATNVERHLYLTDYRSLYVGHVTAITFADVRPTDAEHVPAYVREQRRPSSSDGPRDGLRYRHDVDCWFKLSDLRRIVTDDTPGVVAELARLRNVHDGGRPVSLYGSMHDMPLVVERDEAICFFDPEERDHLSGRRWWVDLDAERGRGIAAIERDLRDNVLGEDAWLVFDPTARAFIASAELAYRDHRTDPAYDFSPVVLGFAKAMEIQLRWLVRAALTSADPKARVVALGGDEPKDLLAPGNKMPALGQMAFLFRKNPAFSAAIERLPSGAWLTQEFRRVLDRFSRDRNLAAHDGTIGLKEATKWRNEFLGVGQPGILERFASIKPLKGPER